MKVIIVQGMACLGKSSLCEKVIKHLENSIYLSVDKYKEKYWDEYGFNTPEEREHLSNKAKKLFCSELEDKIKSGSYDYILVDYVFHDELWNELLNIIKETILVKTVYMKPINIDEHKKCWNKRSKNFSIRHPGHGASCYHNGIGENYNNTYEDKIFSKLPTFGDTLNVKVYFEPKYKIIPDIKDILTFLKDGDTNV